MYTVYGGRVIDIRLILAFTRNDMTSTICPLYLEGILYLAGFVILLALLLALPVKFMYDQYGEFDSIFNCHIWMFLVYLIYIGIMAFMNLNITINGGKKHENI